MSQRCMNMLSACAAVDNDFQEPLLIIIATSLLCLTQISAFMVMIVIIHVLIL